MRIGAIACEMLMKEFELLISDDDDSVHAEFLD